MPPPVHVVGGGLAGSEAAWQLARRGRSGRAARDAPVRGTRHTRRDRLAELVCSNSFRSDDAISNAVGLLHAEMRRLGSLVLAMGDRHKLPAGGALAVDRDGFADAVPAALAADPLVTLAREEVAPPSPRPIGVTRSSPPGRSPRLPWPRTFVGSAAWTSLPSSTP